MMFNAQRVTIYWDFVKSLEAPRVVHIRTNDVFFKGNTFAQVTVRFFSKQVSRYSVTCNVRSGTMVPFIKCRREVLRK